MGNEPQPDKNYANKWIMTLSIFLIPVTTSLHSYNHNNKQTNLKVEAEIL